MEVVTMQGEVKRFQGNGRKLGYPTANITTNTEMKDGVYFGNATLSPYSNLPALIFIGVPTTMGDTERRLEVHILDIADKDYYDQQLEVTVAKFCRPNQTFNNIDELKQAMRADEAAARAWFAANPLDKLPISDDTE